MSSDNACVPSASGPVYGLLVPAALCFAASIVALTHHFQSPEGHFIAFSMDLFGLCLMTSAWVCAYLAVSLNSIDLEIVWAYASTPAVVLMLVLRKLYLWFLPRFKTWRAKWLNAPRSASPKFQPTRCRSCRVPPNSWTQTSLEKATLMFECCVCAL